MELHLYPDMVILPDFCFFVYSFAKKITNKIPRKICKKVRQYTIYNNFLQFIKKCLHYLNISYIINFGLRMDSRVAKGGQTVNLLATLSKVRILLHPSKGSDICLDFFLLYYKAAAPSSARGCRPGQADKIIRFAFC